MSHQLPNPIPDVEDSLLSIHCQEQRAIAQGDRASMIVAKLVWAETYLSAYGVNPESMPALSAAVLSILPADASPIPGWKRRLKARPLRKVIKRSTHKIRISKWATTTVHHEDLECGHCVKIPAFMQPDKLPEHRRCDRCAEDVVSATAKSARRPA